jgi:PAS domain S-box-containing protein
MSGTRFLSGLTAFLRGQRGLSVPSPVLLALAGFDGKLKFLNPAWEKILGYPQQELLDRPLSELMQQHGQAAAALVDRLLAEDNFDSMEFGLRCHDGTCKWFLWHRRFDSEHQAIFIAGYDLTNQKSQEIASLLRSYQHSKRADAAV